jgi:hypothetical protein
VQLVHSSERKTPRKCFLSPHTLEIDALEWLVVKIICVLILVADRIGSDETHDTDLWVHFPKLPFDLHPDSVFFSTFEPHIQSACTTHAMFIALQADQNSTSPHPDVPSLGSFRLR